MDIATSAERPAQSADAQLIERARHGDASAFDALVEARLQLCYRLAWSILLNDADAADATQEAFVAAWRQLPRLRDAREAPVIPGASRLRATLGTPIRG
jgi:hypothetical protein